jgi:hypothetical protein
VSLWNTLGLYNHLLRRFSKSLEARQRAVEIIGDEDDLAHCGMNGVVSTQIRFDGNTTGVRRDLARGRIPNCVIIDFHDRNFESIADRAETGENIWLPILAETYRQLGLREQEKQAWTRMKETYVGDWRNSFGFLAVAEAGLGNREAALNALAKFRIWMDRDEGAKLDNYNTFAAYVYVSLGMNDELFKVLDADASGPGYMNADWLRKSWFDPVRNDPRFEIALEEFENWEIDASQTSESS